MTTIPDFDNIKVSTKTIIGVSDLKIPISELYELLPVEKYVVIPKKRGRQKKIYREDPNKNLKEGSIITLKYQDVFRGVDLNAKKNKKKKTLTKKKFFRNALTVVMKIDDKLINFKISNNGKFQLTGVKKDEQAIKCIQYFWKKLKNTKFSKESISITFINVMTNIDFNVGFIINRENLDKHMNSLNNYNSLLETSFGYTGVNIKFPLNDEIEMDLQRLSYDGEKWCTDIVKYSEYLNTLSDEARFKEETKQRYNTFLVFHSGNVIMSGMVQKYMRPVFNDFVNIIKNARNEIEEKLDI